MNVLKVIFALGVLLAIQGCAIPVSTLERASIPNAETESVVIFNLKVDESTESALMMEKHSLKGDTVKQGYYDGDRQKLLKPVSEGYYVLSFPKLSNSNAYSLYIIWGKENILQGYGCHTNKRLAIDIHESGLFYLGDLSLQSGSPSAEIVVEKKLVKAKEYLSDYNKNLNVDDLTFRKMKIFKTEKCRPVQNTIYIYI